MVWRSLLNNKSVCVLRRLMQTRGSHSCRTPSSGRLVSLRLSSFLTLQCVSCILFDASPGCLLRVEHHRKGKNLSGRPGMISRGSFLLTNLLELPALRFLCSSFSVASCKISILLYCDIHYHTLSTFGRLVVFGSGPLVSFLLGLLLKLPDVLSSSRQSFCTFSCLELAVLPGPGLPLHLWGPASTM